MVVIEFRSTYLSLATESMEYVTVFGHKPKLFISDSTSIAFGS